MAVLAAVDAAVDRARVLGLTRPRWAGASAWDYMAVRMAGRPPAYHLQPRTHFAADSGLHVH